MEILLWIYFSGMGIFWYVFYLYVARMSRRLPQLTKVAGAKQNLAKLSVIVTAKDEAHTIEQALQTLLEQDYPDFEVIIVNDRSTDNTGKIIDRFSKTHPKIVPLHIDHLPDNWIGKVHALHTAVQHASGEWLLFTDADVHHHPTLWQRAIQYAQSRSLKHLALMPSVPTDGRLLQACVRAFGFMFLSTAKIEQIENPNSKAAIGIGAFNLVRHDALKNSPGFEWLRMEVADDYGIGIMLKAAGYKIGFATALDDLKVEWYHTIPQMVVGLEKNIMAPGTQFKTLKLIISPVIFASILIAPFLSLLVWQPPVYVTGIGVFLGIFIISLSIADKEHEKLSSWLLTPIGLLIILYTFTRACILCLARDGIIWRDTFYPRALLQKYQRVKL